MNDEKNAKGAADKKQSKMYRVVFRVVKLFFVKLKINAEEKIMGPAVFVCNHLGAFGPIAMMLHFPHNIRPWVNYRTTTKGEAAKEIARNLFREDSRAPEWFKKIAGKVLEKPALWVMKALNAIPVYDDAVNVTDTLNESVKALKAGTNIVVFADRGGEHIDESVKEGIHIGCLYLAPLYGKKTQENLLFYPVHISRRRREIIVGRPVFYNRKNNFKDEIRRMGDLLSDSIQKIGNME